MDKVQKSLSSHPHTFFCSLCAFHCRYRCIEVIDAKQSSSRSSSSLHRKRSACLAYKFLFFPKNDHSLRLLHLVVLNCSRLLIRFTGTQRGKKSNQPRPDESALPIARAASEITPTRTKYLPYIFTVWNDTARRLPTTGAGKHVTADEVKK